MKSSAQQYGVCDLKYAIELKELGFKQEGLWCWRLYKIGTKLKGELVSTENKNKECIVIAHTATELATILPKFQIKKIDNGYFIKSYPFDYIFDDSLANTMAKHLIRLIKEGIVKL